jgi:hypothetical protein
LDLNQTQYPSEGHKHLDVKEIVPLAFCRLINLSFRIVPEEAIGNMIHGID